MEEIKEEMKSKSVCLSCAEKRKIYYSNNKSKIIGKMKEWAAANKDKINSYNKEKRKEWSSRSKEKLKEYSKKYKSTVSSRYKRLQKSAIKRNIDFDLSFDDYSNLIKNECYYCDGYFGKVKLGSGLDRINNNIGYYMNNVVSCCKICNQLKSNIFSFDETKAAVKAILMIRMYNGFPI
jgi:hypothetical protein